MGVEVRHWGRLDDGRPVQLATLSNGRGFEAKISDFGARIVSILAPDRDGIPGETVLGFAALEDYLTDAYRAAGPYFGATVGRYANRIGGARFTLDGKEYRLAANEGTNQLHGGPVGFNQAVWTMTPLVGEIGVRLIHHSPDGDQGFPGAVSVSLEVVVASDANTLILRYCATTDRPTHINLTTHPYFNLATGVERTIHEHEVTVLADHYTPADDACIPMGDIVTVLGGPLNLTAPRSLGAIIDRPAPGMRGLNHNYVLGDQSADTPRHAATLSHAATGRRLEVWTTEPGLQVYSGGYLPELQGRNGEQITPSAGVCLETQHFPDSPNQPNFPTTRREPDTPYRSQTELRYSAD